VLRDEPGGEPTHVVVLRTQGAPERRRSRRRHQEAPPEPGPAPVPTTAVTVIEADGMTEDEARAWVSQAGRDDLEDAVSVVNRVLAAQRVAAADPYVAEVGPVNALVARTGYGRGEQVADGRWEQAVEIPLDAGPRRGRRVAALRPQERLAAVLGARDEPLACEELTLRARADLDGGRLREAALQVRVALEAGLAELERNGRAADMPERLGELREQRGAVGDAANHALAGPLPEESAQAVRVTVERLEAALRARSAVGFDD
jgi:hypothetical protein